MQAVMLDDIGKVIFALILGVLICVIFVLIIKQVSGHIVARNMKIIYWKCIIPLFASIFVPIIAQKALVEDKIGKSLFIAIFILAIVGFIFTFVYCVRKLGLLKGICMFFVQLGIVIGLIMILYVSVVIFVCGLALACGSTIAFSDKYMEITALYDYEIEYVIKNEGPYFSDREGRVYYQSNTGYLIREEDDKFFDFTDK